MSIGETSTPEADTPSSTSGSSAGSPGASLPPPTPLSPESRNLRMILAPAENESSASSAGDLVTTPTSTGPVRRKPSRRANTAERRATHNAVERQRRETLNGRFLDLAALLPNLATVRRPSKSAIVNSSIASLHAARRTRLLAARELRLLRSEAESLRCESNEWRAGAGLPRVEEPLRSQEFLALISPQEADGDGSTEGRPWESEGLGEMGEEERKAYELALQDRDEDTIGDDGGNNIVGINQMTKGPASTPAAGVVPIPFGLFQRQQQQVQLNFARNAVYNSGMPSHAAFATGVHTIYGPSAHHSPTIHPEFSVRAQMNQEKFAGAWSPQQAELFFAQTQIPQWAPQLSLAAQGEHVFISNSGEERHTDPGPLSNHYFLQQKQLYAQSEQDDSSSVGSVGSVDSNILGSGIVRSMSSGEGSPDSYGMNTMNGRSALGNRKPVLSMSFPGSTWAAQESPAIAPAGGVDSARHVGAIIPVMI